MSSTLRTPYLAMAERMQFVSRVVLCIMLVGWLAWFFPFDDLLDQHGTPLGADFSMFYVAGQLAGDGAVDRLYDQAEHQRRLHQLFPALNEKFCLPYRYPPLVALMAAPLAWLPYGLAYVAFLVASLGAWLATVALLGKQCRFLRAAHWQSVGWSLAGWPVALETLIGGQASMFAALISVATLTCLRTNHTIWAGALLALAAYKPNVLALFAIGLMIKFPRILLGFAGMALLLGSLTYFTCGAGPLQEYVELLGRLAGDPWDVETPYWKVHGLASWVQLVVPQHARLVTIGIGLAASIGVGIWWRLRASQDAMMFCQAAAGLLVINALFNPYTPIYDLVILAPAVVLGVEYVHGGARTSFASDGVQAVVFQFILAAIFFGPHLSQALAKRLGVQVFPWILAAIALWFVGVQASQWRVDRARAAVGTGA